MNFGDYDEFNEDNNPFLGSAHFLSNGIDSTFGTEGSKKLNSKNTVEQGENSSDLVSNTINKDANFKESPINPLPLHFDDDSNLKNIGDQVIDAQQEDYAKIIGYEAMQDSRNKRAVFYTIEGTSGKRNLSKRKDSGELVKIHRRYSDFVSLRLYLVKFFQTKVIPPIPERHSLGRLLRHPFGYTMDTQIISRRIRLLNYFLKRVQEDHTIRDCQLMKKFLNPDIRYWFQALEGPPFTSLSSKSILLTSPRDPTTPSAYFSYLPLPKKNQTRHYKSSIEDTVFVPIEKKTIEMEKVVRRLEKACNMMIRDFNENRKELIEMGGFFNIFSIVEDDHEIIEGFGDKVDMTFINIEVLVNNLTCKVKEKLMIIRLTLQAISQVLEFRKLKEVQHSVLEKTIIKKQMRLEGIMNCAFSEQRINEVLREGSIKSPSLSRAISDLKVKRKALRKLDEVGNQQSVESNQGFAQKRDHSSWRKAVLAIDDPELGEGGGITTGSLQKKNIESMSERELQIELARLGSELNWKLIPCFEELSEDIKYMSIEIEANVNKELWLIVKILHEVSVNWKKEIYGLYSKKCGKVWSGDAAKDRNEYTSSK